ncbi:TerC family protein [Pediococcus siamensis]|uniref:TerC family protein n=1 Tax=Pediococcus siamensis TaxID=381829 RepID=UPI00399F73E2
MQLISKLYGPFFDPHNWETVVTSSSDWMIILSLVMIECLLSVDNAVVLATQTQVLTNLKDREKSLFYGLWGAYVFRFLVIGIGTYLIHIWEIKIIGALYLLYMVYRYFAPKKKGASQKITSPKVKKERHLSLFWSVVLQIEMMDIIFSVDSVLASLAISSNPVIVLIGGMIGILCMRGIAEIIMNVMRKIPELETMAYVLIAIIGIKLFVSIPLIGWEVPSGIFALIVVLAVLITLAIHFYRVNRQTH